VNQWQRKTLHQGSDPSPDQLRIRLLQWFPDPVHGFLYSPQHPESLQKSIQPLLEYVPHKFNLQAKAGVAWSTPVTWRCMSGSQFGNLGRYFRSFLLRHVGKEYKVKNHTRWKRELTSKVVGLLAAYCHVDDLSFEPSSCPKLDLEVKETPQEGAKEKTAHRRRAKCWTCGFHKRKTQSKIKLSLCSP
jgi:hypothetical protein